MQIKFISVMVQDQETALTFYTKILGFTKMADIPMGAYRWLTLTSPDGMAGVELVLEAMTFPPSVDYQKARFEAGIPALALITTNIEKEYHRLRELGVQFHGSPVNNGVISNAIFEDTCGNLVNLVQPAG